MRSRRTTKAVQGESSKPEGKLPVLLGRLAVTPIDRKHAQLDVYVNWGHGFHSNDVRGVFATPSVTPLTRAVGEEVGAHALGSGIKNPDLRPLPDQELRDSVPVQIARGNATYNSTVR